MHMWTCSDYTFMVYAVCMMWYMMCDVVHDACMRCMMCDVVHDA